MSHDRPVDGAPRKEDDQDAWDKWHDELLLNVHRVRSYDTAIDPGNLYGNGIDGARCGESEQAHKDGRIEHT